GFVEQYDGCDRWVAKRLSLGAQGKPSDLPWLPRGVYSWKRLALKTSTASFFASGASWNAPARPVHGDVRLHSARTNQIHVMCPRAPIAKRVLSTLRTPYRSGPAGTFLRAERMRNEAK